MKRFLILHLLSVSGLLLIAGCQQDHVLPQPAVVPVAHGIDAEAVVLRVDTARSVIRWKGTKFWGLGKHEGIVRLASGSLHVAGDAIVGGMFAIDMNTIEVTDIPKSDPIPRRRLRNHLMHDDFFAVATYPTARFTLTDVRRGQADVHHITGDLTLRGQTHPVTFDAEIPRLSERAVEASARFRINRQRWGVAYRGSRLTNDLVDDTIHLELMLIATEKR